MKGQIGVKGAKGVKGIKGSEGEQRGVKEGKGERRGAKVILYQVLGSPPPVTKKVLISTYSGQVSSPPANRTPPHGHSQNG